jgi:CBS domain-containing protein
MEVQIKIIEIMTREPELISPDASIKDAAKRMKNEDIGALPVGENDRLIGMVTDRDIAMRGVAEGRAPETTPVRDVMSEKILYCFEDDDIEDAAQCMAEHQVRRLPILNRDKRLTGIVSLADIAQTGEECEKTALEGVSEPSSEPRKMTIEIV